MTTPDWTGANCLDSWELMHPLGRDYRSTEWRAAKDVCTGCPLTEACLEWALTHNEPYGVWAGLDPDQRATLGRRTRRRPDPLGPGDPRHGSEHGYSLHKCRCDACSTAAAAARARRRAVTRAVPLADDDPRHGTYTGYDAHGCRCEQCRAAKRERRASA